MTVRREAPDPLSPPTFMNAASLSATAGSGCASASRQSAAHWYSTTGSSSVSRRGSSVRWKSARRVSEEGLAWYTRQSLEEE